MTPPRTVIGSFATTRGAPHIGTSRGSLLVELGVAIVVLGVVIALSLQLLATTSLQQGQEQNRHLALIEAQNVLERVCSLPPNLRDPATLSTLGLDLQARKTLPGAELSVALEPTVAPLPMTRVRVEVRWRSLAQSPSPRVTLTAWVAGAAPPGEVLTR